VSKRDLVPVQIDSHWIGQRFLVCYYYIHFLSRFSEPPTPLDGFTWGIAGVWCRINSVIRYILCARVLRVGVVGSGSFSRARTLTRPFLCNLLLNPIRAKQSQSPLLRCWVRLQQRYFNRHSHSLFTHSIKENFSQSPYYSCKVYVHPYN